MSEENPPHLNAEQIREGTQKGLKKYENLSFIEQYAMYMGMAQLLEFGLKKLYEEKFGGSLDDMERWTLGKTRVELERKGLREDFIALLKGVTDSRNHIAHEILANEALMNGMMNKLNVQGAFSKNKRILWKAINELEHVCFLFDWTNENNGWD
ncbi:hypothetical protein J4050_08595 [Winogradskyella sp. DF17]|uniref:RiboL-PSP-HEPN domain-containing protein n=1 Tax=Winogradskyella pelagia TaxID=2819984 RepID=A0ABS3T231_9FLAO|nr:hypothetical protein [Winogradskyella sp. DF17]MBO3116803.1 hypothetical protein [Winogradskyella sp. DF17]